MQVQNLHQIQPKFLFSLCKKVILFPFFRGFNYAICTTSQFQPHIAQSEETRSDIIFPIYAFFSARAAGLVFRIKCTFTVGSCVFFP